MSAQHTRGHWFIVPYGDGDSLAIHSDDQNRVCFMATHGGSRDAWQRIQTNANLIAAAPELLEAADDALKALIGVDELLHRYGLMEGEDCPAIEPLRAAISKAKGEKS